MAASRFSEPLSRWPKVSLSSARRSQAKREARDSSIRRRAGSWYASSHRLVRRAQLRKSSSAARQRRRYRQRLATNRGVCIHNSAMQGALGLVVSGTDHGIRWPRPLPDRRPAQRLRDRARRSGGLTAPLHGEARGETLIVTDLDSANGTFVNERLVQTCTVGAGRHDSRRLGHLRRRGAADTDARRRFRRRPRPVDRCWSGPRRDARAGDQQTVRAGALRLALDRLEHLRHRRLDSACCSARSGISRSCTASRKCWPRRAI